MERQSPVNMLYLLFSVLCSSLMITVMRLFHRPAGAAGWSLPAAMAAAAAGAASYAVIFGQFGYFDPVVLLFGVAIGATLGATGYFLTRAAEEDSLLVSPATARVAWLAPLLLSLFFFDNRAFAEGSSLTLPGQIGLGVGALGLLLAAAGLRLARKEISGSNPRLTTLFVLLLIAFLYVGIQMFDAVEMAAGVEGFFLLVMFAAAAVILACLSAARREKPAAPGILAGVFGGAAMLGAFLFLFLALTDLPGWRVFGLGAFGHVLLAGLLGIAFRQDRPRLLGALGLLALAGGATLLVLA